ncbi:exonuclease domain-containing protein [Phenylobacterium sp.]|uniref:exonuclease domain-containing protein n=1 Tax=Phenylobacterium sp. TaxID=1871053 RepID=UPI0035B16189
MIDIETTGAQPQEIIEIGTVDVVAHEGTWRVEAPRSRLFRPQGAISVHAMAIHHLTPDDLAVADAPCTDATLIEAVRSSPAPDALVAHNASFESQYISRNVTGPLAWICTMRAARHAWPDAPGHSNQVLRYWRGLRLDPQLAMPPHRAAPDAWVTAHILIELLQQASVEDLLAWSKAARPLQRIPFGKYKGRDWSAPPVHYLKWLVEEPEMEREVVDRAQAELQMRALPSRPVQASPL